MSHLHRLHIMAAMCLLLGCDSGDGSAPKPETKAAGAKAGAKTGDTKAADAKAADAKAADAKAADAKAGDPKTGDAKAGDAEPGERHFDLTKDKSGVLARSAAALEVAHALDTEDIQSLSHHAEKLPAADVVCKHVAAVRGTGSDIAQCVKDTEHHVVKLGPELYAELATCLTAGKTAADLDGCDAAASEAETFLHDKPHGEGLDQATCDAFFVHFETISMAEAGDHADIVKEVLEEVRPDLVAACIDQGTKAEMECGTKAKTLHELDECAPQLL